MQHISEIVGVNKFQESSQNLFEGGNERELGDDAHFCFFLDEKQAKLQKFIV